MDIPGTEGINVYADAKTEYTRQLSQFTQPALLEYFLKMLENIKESEKEPKKLLLNFQNSLKQIPEWNYEKVQKDTSIILKEINCDYYDELLSAVFIAHTKVLSAIRLTSKQKKLQITIPKIDHFLHHTLIECARIIWSNVFLFSPSGTGIERQKNFRQIEQLIQDGILQSIRSMLPVKNILKEYLKDDDDDEDEDEDNDVPEKDTPKKDTPKTDVPEKDVPEKDVPKKDVPKKDVPKKDVPEKNTPAFSLPTLETTKKSSIKSLEPPIISVDTKPSVKFAEVNTIIDIESTNNSEDNDDDETINILDSSGEVLDDFEILDEELIEYESL